MSDVNVVVLVGRLTRDAELKYTNSGSSVCRFSLAINRRKKQGEQWVDEPHFFEVDYWGKGAEAISQYLTKGKQVAVDGELRQDRWEQDGQSRSKVIISANNVQLLGSSGGTGSGGGAPRAAAQGQGAPYGGSAQTRAPGTVRGPEPAGADDFPDDIPF
jgi:single-strand DNA-binding protein